MVKPIDGTVIDVVLVRGAILTCFFGNTYVFFVAFDLREMGETLAVFRSTALLPMPFELDAAVIGVGGNVLMLLLVLIVPFDNGISDASINIRGSASFCCCCCGILAGRTTIFVKSFRRLGNAFICVLKNPVIFVCERMFDALPLLILLLIPEVTVAEDFNPLLFDMLPVRFESVSYSDIVPFAVEFVAAIVKPIEKKRRRVRNATVSK